MRRRSAALAGLTASLLTLVTVEPATAEDCAGLYAAIQAVDGGSAGPGEWDRAAAQQRREIERTQRYTDELGCSGGQGFEATEDDPRCGPAQARLRRMEDNLARLEDQAQGGARAEAGRRADLLARYNAACVGPAVANPHREEATFPDEAAPPADGGGGVSAVEPNGDIMEGGEAEPTRGGAAVCVRTCDGGWFPLPGRPASDAPGSLDQLCQASCPNTEARLYTMAREGDLASAVSAAGESYTSLRTAFRFEKSFQPACSCKPPGRSWAEALAPAEALLASGDRRDVTVTATMSDRMARPGPVPATPVKPNKAARTGRAGPDTSATREAQKALSAPTASNDTSGIGGRVRAERVIRQGEGPTVAVDGPEGVRRRVRLIAP